MSTPKHILIIGATGLIGQPITTSLQATGDFSLSILTSSASSVSKKPILDNLAAQGIKIVVADVTSATDIERAFQGIDTIVCALGRPGIDLQIQLLEIAERTLNVKWFWPSEFGTDIEYDETSRDEPTHQAKLRVRKYVRENVKRLQVRYLVTGPYADTFIGLKAGGDLRAGGYDAVAKTATLEGDGSGKVSLTSMVDVGKLLAASVQRPEVGKERPLRVNSFTTTPKELLAEFEKQTGAKWEVTYTSVEEMKALEKELYAEKKPMAGALTLRRIWASGRTLYEKRDNELLPPVELTTQEEIVAAMIKKQTAQ
ncbi:isoflavone reductase family protein [Microthyrium microscopicum]|uniref:Isoflavone reductase family protein n=1 Tax=Microthyrium microscopicum TaxID=703497 RepID=A0A6A6U363_9PEZI|nr:isoflavone reductase family protein [Microthyrium microscopicum]